MADWYNKTLSKIGKSLIDLDSLSNPKIVPVTIDYVFNQAHEFLSDVPGADRVATPAAMTNVIFGTRAVGIAGTGPTDYEVYHTFDDADLSGTTYFDTTANNHDLTTNNSPTTGGAGQVGESVAFDGINQYCDGADSASMRPSNVTVCAWVKATANGAIAQSASAFGITFGGWILTTNNFFIRDGGSVNRDNSPGSGFVFDGTYQHVAGVYDGTDIKIYLNGVLKGTTAFAFGLGYTTANKFRVGCREQFTGSRDTFITGSEDELKIFNRALSDTEIAEIANVIGNHGWLDADDPVVTSPTLDDVIEAFIMLNDTGVEATSPILFYSDEAIGLPFTVATTGNINIQLGSDKGIAKL